MEMGPIVCIYLARVIATGKGNYFQYNIEGASTGTCSGREKGFFQTGGKTMCYQPAWNQDDLGW